MAVPTAITDLSVTAASNSPAGADAVAAGTGPDDYLRALSAIVRREQAQATAVASATTVDLGAITTGNYVHITGTTTITSFGTVAAGVERTVVFDGALTLTHNSTSLVLPSGANISTAAGDVAVLRSEGSGNWRCVSYQKKSGNPVLFSVLDEDDMASDSAVNPPSQQSTKAFVEGRYVSSSVVNAATTHPAEFTGIPSWVKRITIALNGVSTDTVGTLSVQLGVAAGYVTSGYTGFSGTNQTAGGAFLLYGASNAATKTGIATLVLSDSSNGTWIFGSVHQEGSTSYVSTGTVTLSDTLTKLKVYTATGATDAGSVTITYE